MYVAPPQALIHILTVAHTLRNFFERSDFACIEIALSFRALASSLKNNRDKPGVVGSRLAGSKYKPGNSQDREAKTHNSLFEIIALVHHSATISAGHRRDRASDGPA